MLRLIAFCFCFFPLPTVTIINQRSSLKHECPLIIEGLKGCCKDAEQMYPSGLAHSTTGLHASC